VPHVTGVEVARTGPITVLRAGIDQPAHCAAARQAVKAIRAIDTPFEVAVTGDTALLIDYQHTITEHLPWAVAIIAVGTLILLFLFTGSILLPVKAVATNLLSIGAALGAVVWVFQQGHLATWFGTTRLDATHVSVPVLVAAIAFGLSVDKIRARMATMTRTTIRAFIGLLLNDDHVLGAADLRYEIHVSRSPQVLTVTRRQQ
jgi:RND superfamily putative drug exporter